MENLNKKQFNKWVKALRSGEFKQTQYSLQDEKGYCCLGVACKVLIPDNKINKRKYNNDLMSGGIPSWQPYAPDWLKGINDDFKDKMDYKFENNQITDKYKMNYSLGRLNDELLMTFDEIADCLELVYVHKIFS